MKKAFLFVMVVVGLMSAQAMSYLNFLVDESGDPDPILFDYARVGVSGTSYYLNIQGTSSSWVASETPYTTESYYADLSDCYGSSYSYYVELYDSELNVVGRSAEVCYDFLKPYIATEMGQGGVTSTWTVSSFDSVPEPMTGVLVLLGIGALALRRKRNIACLVVLAIGFNVLADANDTLLSFSTVGPDKYADGTVVKDGESYALVWEKTGTTFAGFAADGTVVDNANSALLLTAPIAQDGRCPATAFEINAKVAEKYSDGMFNLYLLDTRLANGALSGLSGDGKAKVVNGYGLVESSSAEGGAVKIVSKSSVPADTPRPTIKAIKVESGYAYLTVSGTVPYLQYKPMAVDSESAATTEDSPSVQGTANEDIILVAPAKGASGLYQVGRP